MLEANHIGKGADLADLTTLQQTLGISFKDTSHLEQALVHSSYLNENPHLTQSSNERLEFLGDAVLGLVVAEKLYRDHASLNEGEMTKRRATLVRRETLARIAEKVRLGDYLYMGKGEEAGGGRHKPSNLAAALEAVTAAIFLDQGLAKTRDFILRLFDTELKRTTGQGVEVDYKSELQHVVQARKQEMPTYQLVEATGPEHGKTFTVEVRVGEEILGRGSGKSKKAAEAEAARAALELLATHFTG